MKELDFSILPKAGITQGDFSVYAGVSRVTVNNWVHKRLGVHEARHAKIEKLLGVIRKAVADKQLPLPTMSKEKRTSAIKRVILEYLKAK